MSASPLRTELQTQPSIAILFFLFVAFALTGVLTALPGPLLPVLLKKWLLTDATAGSLIATQFLGNVLGSIFANRNLRASLLLGLGLMSIGTAGFAFLGWPDTRACFFCYGIGLGLAIPAINLIVAALLPNKRAASLNWLNCVWGLGAISCPGLMMLAQRFSSAERLLLGLGLGAALLLLILAWERWPDTAPVVRAEAARATSLWLLLFFGIAFFLYVGTETCVASWINVYAQRKFPGSHLLTFSLVAYFWAALALGRAVCAYILKWVAPKMVYGIALSLAFVSFAAILGGRSAATLWIGTVLCGLALAPVFPLLLSFASGALLSHPNSGWVLACAPVGGALLPWATGQLSTAYAALHIGMFVPAAAILCLLAMFFIFPKTGNANQPAPAA